MNKTLTFTLGASPNFPFIGMVVLVFLLQAFPLKGQDFLEKTYTTKRLTVAPPDIDGQFDDPSWQEGTWEDGFVQREPLDGKNPSQKTEFKILYDDNYLYVAIQAFDTDPGNIEKRMSRRDDFEGDWVGISIDSYFDKLTAFTFAVTAAGVKNDQLVSNEDQMDETWDPVWYAKTAMTPEGWNAEMKIPLSQIRFAANGNHVWGLQVMRWLFRSEEFSAWQHIPRESSRWVSGFGELHGINNISPKKEVELIPYAMGKFEALEKEEGNPFHDGQKTGYSLGLDGKVAVTNDLTLNFTINPDFGQVEADPSQVNLTAFEVYFNEQRPFFIEGSNIYNFPLTLGDGPLSVDNLFYSRRIGRRPQYEPELDENEWMRSHDFTRILGAFKLSGKTRNGWSIGLMETVTAKMSATIDQYSQQRRETQEPVTNYFNARVQKDINKGNTILGGMFTSTVRLIEDSTLLFLPRKAHTGGIDYQQFWKDKHYYFGAKAVLSQVEGNTEAITGLQESPQHYFQRPDARHLSVNTDQTSLSGHGGTIEGGKIGGGHWRYLGWITWRSPGLELNDMGFLRQADLIQQVLWAQYRIWEPFAIFRSMNINVNQWSEHDFDGNMLTIGGNINVNLQFKNYWSAGSGINRVGYTVNRSELRGGPALKYPGDLNHWMFIESDSRKKLVFSLRGFNNWGDQQNSRFVNLSLEMKYQPFNSLSLSVEPGFSKGHREMQYVETISLDNENRYIISDIDRRQFNTNIRVNLNITPDLTIQYWAQPFVFTGEYSAFKRISKPMAEGYGDRFYEYGRNEMFYDPESAMYNVDENQDGTTDFSFENPDFSFFEFRSNMVLRWEYVPGSTVYFVWSQGRSGDTNSGNFNMKEDINTLYSIVPHNIFMLKFSYRLSI